MERNGTDCGMHLTKSFYLVPMQFCAVIPLSVKMMDLVTDSSEVNAATVIDLTIDDCEESLNPYRPYQCVSIESPCKRVRCEDRDEDVSNCG